MNHTFKKTAIAMGLAQMAMMLGAAAQAQAQAQAQATGNEATANTAAAPAGTPVAVIVTGQRAALQSAQKIKQNADEVVDSIAADDIGKLPDRSVTEVLQRVSGVTIDRAMARSDPDHFSVEGSGVSVRGLSYVRSELNGRDSFSANGGRSLNFEDVPPELMAGVDIYKNPSAEQVEGAIGGLINLRTAMPFDYKGFKAAISGSQMHSELRKGKPSPSASGMVSNRWKTPFGEVGALVDLAYSESANRTDAVQVEPYYQIQDGGRTVWVPKGAQWRSLNFDRTREGAYGALQWKPSSTLTTSLTYFKSKYKMQWDEQAIFGSADPYAIQVSNGEYGDNGALQKGTLTNTDPAKGINFNNDTRTAWRKSDTTDISWNMRWRPNDRWTVVTDLQKIRANTRSVDSTVATGLKMPKQQLDLTGSVPTISFDDADRAYLANPNNYYWAFTMEHLDRAKADSKAGKIDLKYDFDNPILRDIRFGARMTDRDSTTENSNPSYNWQGITQDWMGGLQGKLAYLGDPRFSGATTIHSFNNFFNGKKDVPAVVFPDVSLAQGYPDSYARLHSYRGVLCAENGTTCDPWNQATFGGDPRGINQQSEKTKALYAQTRFGFDDLKYPIDGNIGLRMVKTDSKANGYTLFSSSATPGPGIPVIVPFARAENFDNSYRNWLPSLNLRLKATDALQFRFAFASALSRPDPSQLQAYTKLTQSVDTNSQVVSYTGEAEGNPNLRPITAKQVDLTAEWYFSPVGSVTLAVFNKRLKDVIVKQTTINQLPDTAGVVHDFTTTAPVNGAKGRARGFELAYQQYFDKLPGAWSGLGLQANFTFVDSERTLYNGVYSPYCTSTSGAANLNLNLNGCDTNGTTFGNLPLENLSRQSYNLALMYDKGPWSARMAYNWRSKSLQAVNVSGTNGTNGTDTNPGSPTFGQRNVAWGLPTWADDYGQVDASVSYKINDRIQIGLEAQNLTDSKYKVLMQQNIGLVGRSWFSSGARYTARLSYNFE